MNKYTYPLIAIMLGSSVACTNMSKEEQGTLTGGAIGAVVGGGIAAATGGDGWTGAAIGAIAGGVIGNIKGKEAE
ncbi:MAG: glycine zipper domain-containing protein [Gammaproteobacteria bacterium]|nr:glycine zipper domain-containing protein [Gammaproteobacteria bacterium]